MTCLYICALSHCQICGTFPPVFLNIFLGSRITLCKCVVCSFAQPPWRTRNWTIVISMRKFYCAPGSKFEKMAEFASIVWTKKVTNFLCFLNIPSKQQHFNLTNGKLLYCFHRELILFWTKLTSRGFLNPIFSGGTQEISLRREILSTNTI